MSFIEYVVIFALADVLICVAFVVALAASSRQRLSSSDESLPRERGRQALPI